MKTRLIVPSLKILRGILFLVFLAASISLQAQPPLRAHPLNVFTAQGQPVSIDVVSKSELGNCNASSIVVGISVPSLPGNSAQVNSNKQIVYTPAASFIGQDSLRYQITCSGSSSEAIILVNVGDRPEVIIDDACSVDPRPVTWTIKELAKITSPLVSIGSIPLTGDLDNDGNIEIVVMPFGSGTNASFPNLYIFSYDESRLPADPLFLKYTVLSPVTNTFINSLVIANVDGNGYSSIFLTTFNTATSGADARQLIKYEFNGTSWQEAWRREYSNNNTWHSCPPIVADFMGNGNVQVAVYDKIWNAKDGTLLVDGGFLGASGYNFGNIGHGNGYNSASWSVADIDNDGKLEIVAGNCVYKVNIADPDATHISNTYTRITAATGAGNGSIAIADMDMDGQLDVITTWRVDNSFTAGRAAVYNPRTGTLMSQIITSIPTMSGGFGPSTPFIGDINGDFKPDVIFTGNSIMQAYSYTAANQQLFLMWSQGTTDTSASTTMSLFDFNQDGISELIYRDETDLRIINGSGKSHITGQDTLLVYNLTTFPVYSTTIDEYPVVVDINNDGAAEIITTGLDSGKPYNGYLRIYSSNDPDAPWAPARPVWNQYAYNPLYVNDDLTIPKNPLNPATFFVDKDGNRHQPFNNFLQQATLLNGEGKMLAYGPNFEFAPNTIQINQSGAIVDVDFEILNTGDADYSGPITISFYVFENGIFRKLATYTPTVDAETGTSVPVSYQITSFPATLIATNTLQVRINEEDGQYPVPECTYSGNYSQELFGAPNYAFCADGTGTLYFYPQNSPYIYYWYNENPNQNPSANSFYQGDAYPFTKKANQGMERFYVKVHDGTTWLNNEIYDVNVFLVPDSLVWTGAGSGDWNDPANWNNPGGGSQPPCTECAAYQIPGACTNVEIPGGKTRYPELTSQASPPTVYADYLSNRIHFGFGGEVKRTDSLQYREAFVDLTLNSNQWYLFSPPLHDFYPGDFYVSTPNSYHDGYFVEPMLLEVANPQTGTRTSDALWTGSFNNADYPLVAGSGVAVWVDKRDTWYDCHDPVTFRFPKSDPFYYYYTDYGVQLGERTPDLNRERKNRFVYEGSIDSEGIVSWTVDNVAKDTMILTGNPFMAHLDFEAFAALNAGKIKDEYKLAYGVTPTGTRESPTGAEGKVREFVTRMKSGSGYVSVEPYSDGSPALTSYIAPMQAFVVTPLVSGTLTLRANAGDTEVSPGAPLRSASAGAPFRTLKINALRAGHASQALLLLRENGSHDYISSEDSHKLFPGSDSVSVMVYTRSADGYALDINTIGDFSLEVPVGIRTARPGEIRLKFAGMESFDAGTSVFLHDRLSGTVVNLSETDEYVFEKYGGELYLENRFFLTFSGAVDIREIASGPDITIRRLAEGRVRIASNGGALGSIQITDIRGKVIVSQKVAEPFYEFHAPSPGIYIVRVSNSAGTGVKKLGIGN
ncbi:MAG: hypothetical protein LBP83_08155 [Dysgonamonadaceae bacterium]|nr:hypothetical protein [Dysgonamonadaceae bacterium]